MARVKEWFYPSKMVYFFFFHRCFTHQKWCFFSIEVMFPSVKWQFTRGYHMIIICQRYWYIHTNTKKSNPWLGIVYTTYKNCDLGDGLWHCLTHITVDNIPLFRCQFSSRCYFKDSKHPDDSCSFFPFLHSLNHASTSQLFPIGSMYAIYGDIYHQYTPNVSINLPDIRILWVLICFATPYVLSKNHPTTHPTW